MQQTLLALFAHPDDEAFGTGGTLSQYAAAGADVILVCTTRGEVGEIAEGTGATPETLGEVREAELRCAAETVGVRELIFLGYRDSGMAGTPENAHPRAIVNAPAEEVVPHSWGSSAACGRRSSSRLSRTAATATPITSPSTITPSRPFTPRLTGALSGPGAGVAGAAPVLHGHSALVLSADAGRDGCAGHGYEPDSPFRRRWWRRLAR